MLQTELLEVHSQFAHYNFFNSNEMTTRVIFHCQSRAPGIIPLAPITKSMWTCSVEAAVEYARIVYDVYPGTKLVCTVLFIYLFFGFFFFNPIGSIAQVSMNCPTLSLAYHCWHMRQRDDHGLGSLTHVCDETNPPTVCSVLGRPTARQPNISAGLYNLSLHGWTMYIMKICLIGLTRSGKTSVMTTPKLPGAHIWQINWQIRWQIYPPVCKASWENIFFPGRSTGRFPPPHKMANDNFL